jgi:hypothetical protein
MSATAPSKPYDYFVSYAHADRAAVERLAQALHQKGVRVWWDRWEMRPGDILRERIVDGIERSRNYVLIRQLAQLGMGTA